MNIIIFLKVLHEVNGKRSARFSSYSPPRGQQCIEVYGTAQPVVPVSSSPSIPDVFQSDFFSSFQFLPSHLSPSTVYQAQSLFK